MFIAEPYHFAGFVAQWAMRCGEGHLLPELASENSHGKNLIHRAAFHVQRLEILMNSCHSAEMRPAETLLACVR